MTSPWSTVTAVVALLSLALGACAHPASPVYPPPAASSQLQHDLDAILDNPQLARATWGVLVQSAASGDVLYGRNPQKLLLPASSMKVLTLAAAAERLGWSFTYETTVHAAGTIDGGTLAGDLVVVGSGDPSIGYVDGSADAVFGSWAEQLIARGIRTIAGRVVGDDRAFEDQTLGFGWSWDDLPDDYAAGVGALQFNENAVHVTIAPGPAPGDQAAISVDPPGIGLTVSGDVTTGAADSAPSIAASRLPGSSQLALRGSIPAGARPVSRAVSIDRPTLLFAQALRRALIVHGIDVRGAAVEVGQSGRAAAAGAPLLTHRSPPLSTLANRLMKSSQNQYAETLLKTLAAAPGQRASAAAGRAAAQTIFTGWGVDPGELILRDGSGLSRYDFVSARAIATILLHVYRDDRLREPFLAALPVAGRDGTLGNRMKGTPAEGNVHAKTGSMTGVRTLSGYVTSADGEPLVFAIMANNFEAADVVNAATDAIVVRLAQLRR